MNKIELYNVVKRELDRYDAYGLLSECDWNLSRAPKG